MTEAPKGQPSNGTPPTGIDLPAPPLPGVNPTSTATDVPGQEEPLSKHQAQVSVNAILDYFDMRIENIQAELIAIRGQFSTLREIVRRTSG